MQFGCTSTTHIVSGVPTSCTRPSFASHEGPESNNGQNLLCRTEFHSQSEYRSSTTIARRMQGEDMVAPQATLICGTFRIRSIPKTYFVALQGTMIWSLMALVPVGEATFRCLHLLYGQLTRNVQHIEGLNPRAFRCALSLPGDPPVTIFFSLSPTQPRSQRLCRNFCRMESCTAGC